MTAKEYLRLCEESEQLQLLDTTAEHWIASTSLEWKHGDPIDRLLVATAEVLDVDFITCDESIRQYYGKTIW